MHSFCIQLRSPELLLIALADGRCWLTRLGTSKITGLPVSRWAAQRSSLAASTIEGAIMAGLTQAGDAPTNVSCTLPRYIRWLAGNYVFAEQTPGLFRRAAQRFETSCRRDLAEFARRKAEEEDGHAELAVRDLEALGLPSLEVIRLIRPLSADAFADRFRMYVDSDDPIMLFGFSYCLERMAMERGDALIKKIQSICPLRARAFRFLKVHSNTGSDSAHVHEQTSFFESLNGTELTSVARAAFETAVMLAQQSLMDRSLTDAEIGVRLGRAGIKLPDAEQDTDIKNVFAAS
jgi:pyrroloquinoline quinone (PQQ) biosynthesis protein C